MDNSTSPGPDARPDNNTPIRRSVTFRAVVMGLMTAMGLAVVNCWVATVLNVYMVGGIQMPFGAVFALTFLILLVNLPLRALGRKSPRMGRLLPPFSPVELLTVYTMSMFGALISSPGCDNSFMTMGPGLFYFASPENGWSQLFNSHVPAWFVPGWDGHVIQKSVIDRMYLGGAQNLSEIPWLAWAPMLIAWSIFLLLTYSVLFFIALVLRRQWIENEALAFPLVELPIQMVDVDMANGHPPAAAFWGNRTMWVGFVLAVGMHTLKGLHAHFPDVPDFPINETASKIGFSFPDKPWSAMPKFHSSIYLGAIGLAYLLNRQVSFSFWFFFFFQEFQHAFGEMLGFTVQSLPKAGLLARPNYVLYQAVGGWVMLAALLIWTAREHIWSLVRCAIKPQPTLHPNEPFSPRFVIVGLFLSLTGLLAWSSFAGINVIIALAFFGIFLTASIVIARLVVEGGFLFPQPPFYTLEWMTTGLFGAGMSADSLTKLSFIQPSVLIDMRTNVLPGFLNTMKIADALKMDRRQLRRLLTAVAGSIVATLGVTLVVTLWALYSRGGLTCYDWFTKSGPQATFTTAANYIRTTPAVDPTNVYWMGIGGAAVFLMTLARSRFLWFPFHPLGYIISSAYPITEYWANFLLGWMIKSAVMKYGGSEGNNIVRPFMIGLIFGNLVAMILVMIIGFFTGVQIGYWTG